MKQSSVKIDQDAVRLQLNLKNLKRHDPFIDQILTSTSYATIYYNEGREWAKTNIEGPLFIFSRTEAPTYGFFVLNRNGLDYVKEFLTVDTEVKVEGDFILVEALNADRATGIWVYEEKERLALASRMQALCAPAPPVVQPTQTMQKNIPYNQSIPIDFLFASSSSAGMMPTGQPPPISPPAPPAAVPPFQQHPAGMQLLNSLFESASKPAAAPATQVISPPLNNTFASPSAPQPPTTSGPPRDARALLAMIGHPGGEGYIAPEPQSRPPAQSSYATQPPPPAQPAKAAPAQSSPFAPPLLSHDLFSQPLPKKKVVVPPDVPLHGAALPLPAPPPALPVETRPAPAPAPAPAPPTQSQAPAPKPKPATESPKKKEKEVKEATKPKSTNGAASTKPLEKDLVLNLLDDGAKKAKIGMTGHGTAHEDEPLSKADFIQSVATMLQSSGFSTKLYSAYLQRFSALMEERE